MDENMNMNKQPGNAQEQEIDLIDIVKRLWQKRKFILKVTIVFMVLGLLVALLSPKEFTAGSLVVPQTGNKSAGGTLGGLAAMAGISLGNMGESETLSPKIYTKVLNNIDLQKELIYTPIYFQRYEQPVTLLDYYTNDDYRMFSLADVLKKYTIGLPGLIMGNKTGATPDSLGMSARNTLRFGFFSENEKKCIDILKDKYSLAVNDKDGYVTVSATMPEPLAAAQLAHTVQNLLQKYVTEFKLEKAKSQYDFVKKRYDEAKSDYEKKQQEYARFQDANRTLSSALSRTREEQIRAEYTIANSLFSELAKQLVQAEIKVKEDTPILTVVEPVVIPAERSKPQRAIILIMFTFMGVFLGCGVVLTLPFLSEISGNDKLKQFVK